MPKGCHKRGGRTHPVKQELRHRLRTYVHPEPLKDDEGSISFWLELENKIKNSKDPANKEKIISWTKSYYDALHPYSAGGAYVNFLMGDEGEGRVKATYGDNYERLVSIKNKYDPDNFFRVNQNIKPSKL